MIRLWDWITDCRADRKRERDERREAMREAHQDFANAIDETFNMPQRRDSGGSDDDQ